MTSSPGDGTRAGLAAVAGVTIVAALLRFSTLDRQSFWSDEAMTVVLTRLSFGDMLATIGETESTPPLYYVLAWGWTRLLGDGEIGLRSLSALAGTATVPVAFLAGRALAGCRTGVVAAFLVAVSPVLVWYSQEARSYAVAVLLCGVSFTAFAGALSRPAARPLVLWAAASVLALGTHYFALFVVGAEALWLLVSHRRRAVGLAALVVGAFAVPVSLLALDQRGNRLVEVIGSATGLGERLRVLAKQLLVGASLPADRLVAVVVAVLLAASVLILLVRGTRAQRRAFLVAASVGAAAIVLPVVLGLLGLDYVNTRNALVGMVPLVVAGSVGITAAPIRLGAPLLAAAGGVLLAIAVVVASDPAHHRSDWRGLARTVRHGGLPRVVVVTPDHQGWFARVPLQVYLPGARAVDAGRAEGLEQFASVSRRPVDRSSPRNVVVREVVLAGVGWDLPAPPLPSSFRVVAEGTPHSYGFVRLRSAQAVALRVADLAAPRSVVLLEGRVAR